MAQYSFSAAQETRSYSAPVSTGGTFRPQSAAQASYYMTLCKAAHISPEEGFGVWGYDEMSSRIAALKERKAPASVKQLEIINKIIERNGFKITFDQSSLTGGEGGSASAFINKLIELEKKNRLNLPPTEAQIGLLLNMFPCPAANFEDLGIEKFIPRELGGHVYKYKLSADEIAQTILERVNQQAASDFIAKYRDVYYEWKQTRLTIGQQEYIRTLEARMMGLDKKGVEDSIIITFEGEEISLSQLTGKVDKQWTPPMYEPLSDLAIAQLSQEAAKSYIDRLSWELSPEGKKLINGTHIPEDETFEELRKIDPAAKEYDALNNIVHALLASMGEGATIEDAQIPMTMEDYESKSQDWGVKKLRSILDSVLEMKTFDYEDLFDLCKTSEIAMRVLVHGK